jgi:iron complex transport system substrate-binding protein
VLRPDEPAVRCISRSDGGRRPITGVLERRRDGRNERNRVAWYADGMATDRIVSLIPSATEIVCALGFEQSLVGRSHECDYPPSVRRLPAVTAPKFNPDGTSYQIDQRVKAILQDALSVYRVDAEALRSLRPTVIVTQEQCEVCAVNVQDVEQAVCDWLEDRPRIVSLAPNSLPDIWADINRVGEALGVRARSDELLRAIQDRMEAISAGVRDEPDRPTVACIEWLDPLMAAGNWMPELVEMAGGVNLFGEAGSHSPWLTWEQLVDADPDVIVVLPCGYDLAVTRRELPAMTSHPAWGTLRAVREGRVFLTDGNQYFNRPGPRLVESLEILAAILHPRVRRSSVADGSGWERL